MFAFSIKKIKCGGKSPNLNLLSPWIGFLLVDFLTSRIGNKICCRLYNFVSRIFSTVSVFVCRPLLYCAFAAECFKI